MISDPNALKIYIDGNAFENPGGSGGIAGIAEFPDSMERDNEVVFQRGYKATTNNRTELRACIEALRYVIREATRLRLTRVLIVSDSSYVCNNQIAAFNWRSNGWCTADGRPAENADLWREFLSERQKVRLSLQIVWEEGKTRAVLKEVDRLAKESGRGATETDYGYRGGQIHRSKIPAGRSSAMFEASGQDVAIHIFLKKSVGNEIKIDFDLIMNAAYKGRYRAYTVSDIAYRLHRGHCYHVRFNDDARHPQIVDIIEEVSCPKSDPTKV